MYVDDTAYKPVTINPPPPISFSYQNQPSQPALRSQDGGFYGGDRSSFHIPQQSQTYQPQYQPLVSNGQQPYQQQRYSNMSGTFNTNSTYKDTNPTAANTGNSQAYGAGVSQTIQESKWQKQPSNAYGQKRSQLAASQGVNYYGKGDKYRSIDNTYNNKKPVCTPIRIALILLGLLALAGLAVGLWFLLSNKSKFGEVTQPKQEIVYVDPHQIPMQPVPVGDGWQSADLETGAEAETGAGNDYNIYPSTNNNGYYGSSTSASNYHSTSNSYSTPDYSYQDPAAATVSPSNVYVAPSTSTTITTPTENIQSTNHHKSHLKRRVFNN